MIIDTSSAVLLIKSAIWVADCPMKRPAPTTIGPGELIRTDISRVLSPDLFLILLIQLPQAFPKIIDNGISIIVFANGQIIVSIPFLLNNSDKAETTAVTAAAKTALIGEKVFVMKITVNNAMNEKVNIAIEPSMLFVPSMYFPER